ncbi:TasA family protein [Calderihabitans maritimus]|uniref:Spore coat protein n=1 Tax=Calderihabitans maritimus TaxID=1246530 RepID=A0A1Z5HRS5_9FIRM|nr:TasA family protein [Calderihabitans maritimus]GAW91970.1 spore coat protein [Calderihabitans maritimus]
MKRVYLSFLVIALVSALVGGATFALFTDEATNSNNTFAAGTIDIELNDNSDDDIVSFTVSNIAPGDSGGTTIKVDNEGSLDLRYDVSIDVDGALFDGNHPIIVTLKDPDGGVLFQTSEDGEYDLNRVLAANGGTETLTLEWSFPQDADNTYQGQEGSFDLTFSAEQIKNN